MSHLTDLTLAEARDSLKNKAISSVEITRAHLEAMARARALNAFVAETAEKALAMAAESDARLARGVGGPLEGLPIGVKDLYATKGVHTQACSHILDGFKPTYESTVTAHLWRDGAVMLGKLNMDEFAMGSSNETSYYGPVASPWMPPNWSRDTARAALRSDKRGLLTPGGSSGGSAAAVSARLCLAATASDTGGSIRQPAAFTGTVGDQADLWTLLALRHGGFRVVARSGRSDRAHRARRRDHVALDGRAGRQGLDLRAIARARLRGRGRQIGQRADDRNPSGVSARRHERGDRGALGARRAMAARRRRARRRRQPAQHATRLAGLLHRRAGRGVEQSRALRRRALRSARSVVQISSISTRRRAPGASARKCGAG